MTSEDKTAEIVLIILSIALRANKVSSTDCKKLLLQDWKQLR